MKPQSASSSSNSPNQSASKLRKMSMTLQPNSGSQVPLVAASPASSTSTDLNAPGAVPGTPPGSPGATKRDIACSPGSVREFLLIFFLGLSRKILAVKAEHKLACYLLVVFLGSIVAELFTLPKDFVFQRVARPFNSFVVKFGYGWILCVCTPLVTLTSRVITRDTNVSTLANFGRLLINTLVWFFTTSTFFWFYSSRGMCLVMERTNASHAGLKQLLFSDCRRAGHTWTGFDISGHTFLLIFCNLVLVEEARIMKAVDKALQQAAQNLGIAATSLSGGGGGGGDDSSGPLSRRDRLVLQVVLCLAGATTVVYDYVLVVTVLFYHTILEKMLAFVFASLAWYACYRVFYPKMAIQPGAGSPGTPQHLL